MKFRTEIEITSLGVKIGYENRVLALGSCFAAHIARKLAGAKFRVAENPSGILFNPLSIAAAIRSYADPAPVTRGELGFDGEVLHHFGFHGDFSAPTADEALQKMNAARQAGADALRTADRIVLTFGTAWVYKLKSSGKVVSNCHRLPEKMFDRQLLNVGEIVAEWKSLLLSLWKQNPELKILFTVSPIRHWKDGAHGNQLSKATLLLAIDALQKEFPEHTAYFPAYEIMMDELREYRFYADDMLHPSTTAIEYIWERFTGSMLSPDSLSILKEWKDIQKAINHKPFQPESEAYKRFISQTLLKMERLNEKFPYFDMTNEVEMIKKKF